LQEKEYRIQITTPREV